jgi:Flp pilus assembly protein TadG
MVTAETALALPALALVVGLMLWALLAATAQLRCVDAARAAARSVARGDALAESVAAGLRLAPAGAHIQVERGGGLVRVKVEATVGPGPGSGFLPALGVSADAVVADEQR